MERRRIFILIIASNAVWALSFLPSLVACGMSVMLFDAPGSEDSLFTNLLFYSVISFPPAVIFSISGTWIFYRLGRLKGVLFMGLLPLLSICCVAVSFGLISFFCQGSLVCP